MLSYRHLFHAGNFADVLKHAVLARILTLLARKDKPFAYLDAYAGTGLYDLTHPWARKHAEHRGGIGRLWSRADVPAPLAPYLDAVRAENPGGKLRAYPGSPRIAARLARASDRLILTELNREDHAALAACFVADRRVGVHHLDARRALKAFLPPQERRGLVLVDPPFDRAGEFDRLVEDLVAAHRRFATGVFALWYPWMDAHTMRRLERGVVTSGIRRVLRFEIAVHGAGHGTRMRGCGVLVVNAPYGLLEESSQWLPWLRDALAQGDGASSAAEYLVPE